MKPSMDLHRFIRDANIARYRRLLESSTDEIERQTLLELLAQEKEKQADEDRKRC